MGNTAMSCIHWLTTFSMDVSAALASYDARVRMDLVMEFMTSLVGAFIMTSLVKLVGSSLTSASVVMNSSDSASSGRSPKRSR